MPRLAPVPDAPPRALGLIRVSKEREDMVSPDIQRVAISDHCARRGYRVVGWVEGIDESGSRRASKWWARLDGAVDQVAGDVADVIVVWRFDRTARNRLRWAVAIDRVETAGGRIESATEPLDTSTPAGRFARGMLGEMAAYRAEEIGAVWRDVQARRTRAGLPASGKPRFGYELRGGVFAPDPKTGPVLAGLYRRYLGGESIYALVRWLNVEGYRTVGGYGSSGSGGEWTQVTLRRVLDSGFGAGLIRVRGEAQEGAHEPVIDRATWAQFLAVRAARRPLRRSERSQYLLSGLMRCGWPVEGGECRFSMGGSAVGRARAPKFRCNAGSGRRHAGGYVSMTVVEGAVIEWLQERAARIDEGSDAVQRRSPGKRRQRDAEVTAREIARLETQLVTLTVQHTRGVVPEVAYVAARDQIRDERDLLEQRHAQEVLAASAVEAGPIAAQLLADWEGLLVPERRAVLRSLLKCVVAGPGGAVRIVPVWGEW